ncbi:MAG: hypothetical protein ACI9GW_002884 [Halieaceae bacterium]
MTVATQPSKLLPLIFDRLEGQPSITVFDAGLAVAESVDFFCGYKCRLHFADLFSEELVEKQSSELSDAEICSQFTELLNFPVGTRFDLCLFWDFLNFLTAPYLRAFSLAMKPYLHEGTAAHGFGVLNSSTALKSQQYGLKTTNELVVRQRNNNILNYYPHPQAEIEKLMPQFSIGRTLLLSGGQVEMLLNARG